MNRKINGIVLLTALLAVLGSCSVCQNDNLDFIRENFFVYRNNINAVNEALKACSIIPTYLDTILFTIQNEQLDGTIILDIGSNIRYIKIDKMSSYNITIEVPKNLTNILRIELISENNWFNLSSPGNFFQSFPNLEHLDAERIVLSKLPSFSDLYALTRIQVVNAIFESGPDTNVGSSFVSGLQNLEFLSWRESSFKSLDVDAFTGLPQLTELSLENNKIERIRMNQFINVLNLNELDLSHNNLQASQVEGGAFDGLINLKILHINSNSDFIPNIVFHPLFNLEEIYLQNNRYALLDFRAFQQKTNLQIVYLFGDNMFDCICNRTEWMANVTKRFNLRFLGGRCDSPAEYVGKDVSDASIYTACVPEFSYDCFGNVSCTVDQICVNTFNSSVCECQTGFGNVTNPLTNITECLDIDECLNSTEVCDQICRNSIGSYTCDCQDGFTLVGMRTCEDIDECLDSNNKNDCQEDGVPAKGLCVNTDGNYLCNCRSGYELEAGNPRNCVDLDECKFGNDSCTQVCVNTPGDYECACSPGFQFITAPAANSSMNSTMPNNSTMPTNSTNSTNGTNSTNNSTDTMDSSSSMTMSNITNNTENGNKGVECEDVNECLIETDECEQICINTRGSYNCSCFMGYNLTGNFSCVDVNECDLNATICDGSEGFRCNNTVGGFECICKEGYDMRNETCVLREALTLSEIIGIGMSGFFVVTFFFVVLLILICCLFKRSRQRVRQKEEGRTGMLASGVSIEPRDEESKSPMKIEDNTNANEKSTPNEYELEAITKENEYLNLSEVIKEEPVEADLTASAEKKILEREYAAADTGANSEEIAQEADVAVPEIAPSTEVLI